MEAVIVKMALAREGTRWLAAVSSRHIGLPPSEVTASGRTPHEAMSKLSSQLTTLLECQVIPLLEQS